MSPNLRKRLAVAGVGVPLCALATYAGGYVFVAGLGTAAALGYREFAGMMRGTGTRVLTLPGTVAAFLFPPIVFAGGLEGGGCYAAGLMLALPALALATVELPQRPMRAAALTAFGVFYVGGLLALGVPLRESGVLLPSGARGGGRPNGGYASLLLPGRHHLALRYRRLPRRPSLRETPARAPPEPQQDGRGGGVRAAGRPRRGPALSTVAHSGDLGRWAWFPRWPSGWSLRDSPLSETLRSRRSSGSAA